MTQLEIKQALQGLNGMVAEGKILDAFNKYYHRDVVMQENNETPIAGKEANYQRELDFFTKVSAFKKVEPLKITIGENCSMVEWYYNFIHQEWGEKDYTQVAVQEWKDGQIIKERFYYGN